MSRLRWIQWRGWQGSPQLLNSAATVLASALVAKVSDVLHPVLVEASTGLISYQQSDLEIYFEIHFCMM